MADSEEPILPGRKRPLFPLTDRRAPVLSRIRDGKGNRSNIGALAGRKVGELALEDDEEKVQEEVDTIVESFREELARELDVPEEAISNMVTEEFASVLSSHSETDMINERVIEDEGSGEEGGDGGSDSPIFS